MNTYQFMTENPWLSGFIAFWVILFGAVIILEISKYLMKSIVIYKHGYPPPYCDAYGDGMVDLEIN